MDKMTSGEEKITDIQPTIFLLSPKQMVQYKNIFGNPPEGQVAVKGYHTWVTDGKGGVKPRRAK